MGLENKVMQLRPPTLPPARRSMQKGVDLKCLLGREAIECLAQNIRFVHQGFDWVNFRECALDGLEPLGLMQRGQHIANALYRFLPNKYSLAVEVIVASLTAERTEAEEFGLAEFFYLPHSFFISEYGQDEKYNRGSDPFQVSMNALRALTSRFTSEYAIRPFLIGQQERTIRHISDWMDDPNPHVRRLCSEGTRPRLPWGKRISSLIADPRPTFHILEALKNDKSLYVRRSVANHLGDIAKDHPGIVFAMCESWLHSGASGELRWLIRHAVRHPARKGNAMAQRIRADARGR